MTILRVRHATGCPLARGSGYRPGTSVTPETGNVGDTVAQNRRWEEEPNALERDDTHARANPLLAGLRARDL